MDLFWRYSVPSWGGTSQEGEFLHAWNGFALEQPPLGLQLGGDGHLLKVLILASLLLHHDILALWKNKGVTLRNLIKLKKVLMKWQIRQKKQRKVVKIMSNDERFQKHQ